MMFAVVLQGLLKQEIAWRTAVLECCYLIVSNVLLGTVHVAE